MPRVLALAVAASVVPLLGCAVPAPGDALHFDPCDATALVIEGQSSPEERLAVASAAQMWNRAVDSRLFVAEQAVDSARITVHFESASPQFHGVYEPAVGEVFINRNLRTERARAITLAHELGHAFALPHDDSEPALMNFGNLDVEVQAVDVQRVRALWGRCGVDLAPRDDQRAR